MSLIKTYKELPVFKATTLATDYADARYGKLTIVRPIRRDETHLYWLAKCECGTQVEVRAHQLKGGVGKIDSCGRCQTLKRYDFPEIPYTLEDDGVVPEQKELPLEKEIQDGIGKALDIVGRVLEVDKPEPTPWDVAGQCCELLEKLTEREEVIKAFKLMRVQMEFGL